MKNAVLQVGAGSRFSMNEKAVTRVNDLITERFPQHES